MNEEFIIRKLLKSKIKGVDNYKHNGSTWLIFTSEKKWVIELTKEGTLWYNHFFFKQIFDFVGLDVVENQHYITKWVEDTIQNGVNHLRHRKGADDSRAENIIQNGVKETHLAMNNYSEDIEDTIQNGVKDIKNCGWSNQGGAEDAIQNGVKYTRSVAQQRPGNVEHTIQNGVKYTSWDPTGKKSLVEDTIQNGVKETKHNPFEDGLAMEEAIQNGVKYTGGIGNPMWMGGRVEDTIQNGVKKTYSDKIPHKYDWSNQFTEEIDDIIQNGVKHTEKSLKIDGSCVIEDVIKEGVKHTEYGDWLDGDERFDDIIENGVKECIPSRTPLYNPMDFSVQYRENHRLDDVASVLEKGIKEVQPLPSQEGNMDYSNYYYRQGVSTKPHTQYVNDVITNGIKKTKAMDEWVNTDRIVDGVIERGEKC